MRTMIRPTIAHLTLGLGLVSLLAVNSTAYGQAKTQTQRGTDPVIIIEEPQPEPEPKAPSLEGPAYLDRVVDRTRYIVGPGDRLGIGIAGQTPSTIDVTVNPEGNVFIPAIGPVSVAKLSLAEAKTAIVQFLREYYPNSEVSVSLLEVRRFRVAVSGAVTRAGLQTVTANTRASEAIELAGLAPNASQRGVHLIREDDTIRVDLAAFSRLGDQSSNPYIREGDILVVPVHDRRWGNVRISGAVKEPKEFEFVDGETVGDVIELAYGFAPNADTNDVELWRFEEGDTVATRVPWESGTSYTDWIATPLAADDHVIVRGVEDYRRSSSVQIKGEVLRPGIYVFPGRNVSLLSLVDSARGFTPEADLGNIRVARGQLPEWETEYRQRLEQLPQELLTEAESDWLLADAISVPGRISTDFIKLFVQRDRDYDVFLSDDDVVTVPPHSPFVSVIGRVVRPGLVPHSSGQGFDYYLDRAGGFAWRADRGGSFVVKGGTGATVKRGSVRDITPGDLIVVPTKRGIDFWQGFKDALVVTANLATIYLVIDQAVN
ncbi:MAG: hypothetical protein GF341_03645 [candidate division Zixibacteria bacterium]|nr:hypothetical protein [candidate division Zixibacteria bacterium]